MHARLVLLALAASVSCLSACDSGGTECTCPAVGLTVTIPPGLTVASVGGSDVACEGAKVLCTSIEGGPCSVFYVYPAKAGACHLDVSFTDGTVFTDDLTVVSTTGCCAGLRADPPTSGMIDVAAPDDAGSLGASVDD